MVYYGFYFEGLTETYTLPVIRSKAEIMHDIADCESGNRHFGTDTKLLIHQNSNGSYDIGVYQINSVWYDTATKLGFNIFDKKDNLKFANWLYDQMGTQPWNSSANCWK